MTDEPLTPEQMLEAAKTIAQQVLGMPIPQRNKLFDELTRDNEALAKMVIEQIRVLRPTKSIAKRGDTMAKDSKAQDGTLVHFTRKGGRKMFTIHVTGAEYTQQLSTGDLYFESMSGTKEVLKHFTDTFNIKNERVDLIIAHPSGRQVLFQAPLFISTIRTSSDDTLGNTQLNQVKMRFMKEVVTLNLTDDDEVLLD